MATFADRMKLYRTMHGLTQTDIAKRLKSNKQTISRYETGEQIPRLDVALDIAQTLKVDVFWLIGIDDIERKPDDPNRIKLCDIVKKLSPEKAALLLALAEQINDPKDSDRHAV